MKEIVRLVAKRDITTIYEIEKVSFVDPYPHDVLQLLLKYYSQTFLVAEKDKQILGYVIATHDRGSGHLLSIAVHPSERRKRIGKKLVRSGDRSKRGCQRLQRKN